MGLLTGKKATALGNPHLCKSCAWGQFMTGYRDSERLAVCTNTSPNMVVPFAMLECSAFSERNRPEFGPAKEPPIDTGQGRLMSKASRFASIEPLRPTRKMHNGQDAEISMGKQVN
jgi:hypothetical protein